VFFKIDRESYFNGVEGKGIAYSPNPLKPLVPKLDHYDPTSGVIDDRGNFVVCKQLNGNWYLFLNG
jgi:hypothetical protein